MTNMLVSRPEHPIEEVTRTTISYVVYPDIGDGKPRPIHGNFSPPFRKTQDMVLDLLSWPEGWNGYDAAAPDPGAVRHALSLIEGLYEDTLTTKAWIDPHVIADAHGSVVLEWWEGRKKLTIYISARTVEYVRVWGPDRFSDMEDGDVEGNEDRRALWRWLTG